MYTTTTETMDTNLISFLESPLGTAIGIVFDVIGFCVMFFVWKNYKQPIKEGLSVISSILFFWRYDNQQTEASQTSDVVEEFTVQEPAVEESIAEEPVVHLESSFDRAPSREKTRSRRSRKRSRRR